MYIHQYVYINISLGRERVVKSSGMTTNWIFTYDYYDSTVVAVNTPRIMVHVFINIYIS